MFHLITSEQHLGPSSFILQYHPRHCSPFSLSYYHLSSSNTILQYHCIPYHHSPVSSYFILFHIGIPSEALQFHPLIEIQTIQSLLNQQSSLYYIRIPSQTLLQFHHSVPLNSRVIMFHLVTSEQHLGPSSFILQYHPRHCSPFSLSYYHLSSSNTSELVYQNTISDHLVPLNSRVQAISLFPAVYKIRIPSRTLQFHHLVPLNSGPSTTSVHYIKSE